MTSLLLALALSTSTPASGPLPTASIFGQPWRWQDDRGQSTSLDHWEGHPVVVTMFYRSCQVRCPMVIERLKKLEQAYAARGKPLQIVLISLDPRHDVPAQLAEFRQTRHLPEETWHLLVGSDADTRALSDALSVHAVYDDQHIDHSTRITLYDSQGKPAHSFAGWSFTDEEALGVE
jgi:protein SCO1/2